MVQIKYLLALAPFAAAALAQGPQFGASNQCGRVARRDQNFGSINGDYSNVGIECTRAEHAEAHLEARDLEYGFDALDAMQARDSQSSNTDTYAPTYAPATTDNQANEGAKNSCRRSMFGLEERNVSFGGGVGSGNNANVGVQCRRSDELAIRDLGSHYRRHLARSYNTDEEFTQAADMLRRHAAELNLA